MRTLRLLSLAAALIVASLASVPATARDDGRPELVAELIHAELPLYTFDWQELWPRGFHTEESFGCASQVRFGDWRFVPAHGGPARWERFGNYGVFHCAAILTTAYEREGLEHGQWKYGFFVRIGKARVGSQAWELWAIQRGMVPGSDYTLLAREADEQGPIRKFRVLQRRCPSGLLRKSSGLDVWITSYCAIDSRAELLALARNMIRLPPLGKLEYVGEPAKAPETDD